MTVPATTDRVGLAQEAERLQGGADALGSLRGFTDLLASDPGDLHAWHGAAAALIAIGDEEAGVEALHDAGRAFAEAGNLPMALVAEEMLLGPDARRAEALLAHVANLYRAGSPRATDDRLTPPPFAAPAPVRRMPADAPREAVVKAAGEALARARDAAKAHAGAQVPRWPLFSALDAALFREFVGLLELRTLKPGDVVVEAGEQARAFYVVARGVLRVMCGEAVVGHLRAGAFFGEMALLARTPRQASVVAETRAQIFEVGAPSVEDLAQRAPAFADTLATHCRKRLLDNFARTSPLLRDFPEEERHAVLARFRPQAHASGAQIIAEGCLGDALYVVLTGEVEVLRQDGADQLRIATLGAGDVFGEISLISRRPAIATVRAIGRAVTLRLQRPDFDAIAAQQPRLLADLYQLGAEREAEADSMLRRGTVVLGDDALL